jgi:hypothetical protein
MTQPIWKDCTTYSQGDKERIPHSFEVISGDLRISITSGHIHYKGQWVMHCYKLGIDTKPLAVGITREQAQAQACKIVENRLAELQQDLEAIPW